MSQRTQLFKGSWSTGKIRQALGRSIPATSERDLSMKALLLLALVMVSGLLQVYGDLLQFSKMIKSKTGKDSVLSYGSYGCFCGLGGKGTPKDGTDWCCAIHDCCYKHLERRGCINLKTLQYDVTIIRSSITCNVIQPSCKKLLCECDKAAASCFANNLYSYSVKYQFYPNLLCTGNTPSC
ncbi:phospholipase A2, membrane associated-like [Cavia porcellus]|uniref:phospholipase A2, membrane associated-like n=1 Tax=Cavia porcellus TaxID=10141 RepID=UPI002FE26D88